MNKPHDDLDIEYPADWYLSDEEEVRLAEQRLEEYRRTGLGHTLEDVRAWFRALDDDPTTPCPPPRKLR